MKFSDALACTVHDIKNSLGSILNKIEELLSDPENQIANRAEAVLLQHEAKRANNNLIQLLSVYRYETDQLSLNVMEIPVCDLINEVVSDNRMQCQTLGLELKTDCDDDLSGFLDEDLIRGVLDSTLGNSLRYARSRVKVAAERQDGYLVLSVEDDGAGYPADMLEPDSPSTTTTSLGFGSGSTRLGLHFAGLVAGLHCAGGRKGFIRLSNDNQMPGGRFEIWLP